MEHLGYNYLDHPNRGAHIVKHERPSWVFWMPIDDPGLSDFIRSTKEFQWDAEVWWISMVGGDVFWSCFEEKYAIELAKTLGIEIELCECCTP